MLVVSDTSPLNYLILVDAADTLPKLFSEVCAPQTVLDELRHSHSPVTVQRWARNPPQWLKIKAPRHVPRIAGIHRGETEAIALAEELAADVVLIDDKTGKRVAISRGLRVMGTLGVLVEATIQKLIDVEQVSRRLRESNFRGNVELIYQLVEERRQNPEKPTY